MCVHTLHLPSYEPSPATTSPTQRWLPFATNFPTPLCNKPLPLSSPTCYFHFLSPHSLSSGPTQAPSTTPSSLHPSRSRSRVTAMSLSRWPALGPIKLACRLQQSQRTTASSVTFPDLAAGRQVACPPPALTGLSSCLLSPWSLRMEAPQGSGPTRCPAPSALPHLTSGLAADSSSLYSLRSSGSRSSGSLAISRAV